MAVINFKFTFGQRVNIPELKTTGKVIGCFNGFRGNEYQVRYCSPQEFKDVYFGEDELTEIN